MNYAPDIEKARRIAHAANGTNDQSTRRELPGERIAAVLAAEMPDLQTLSAACGLLVPSTLNGLWNEQIRLSLASVLQVALVESQIGSQNALSLAADKLARRNYWVATASLIAAGLSLAVSLLQAFHIV